MTQEPATQAGPRIDRVPSPVIGTEAGRALIGASLWDELGLGMTGSRWLARSIVAIEAEAAKIDEDRLAKAIDTAGTWKQDDKDWTKTRPKSPSELAADIAAEYARLLSEESPDPTSP